MAKLKNPFKKKSLIDTLTNVGIGGAANVAIDYAWEQIAALKDFDEYKHLIKIVGGAVVGGMVSNKYARAAADGIATVGVSNFIAGYLEEDTNGSNSKGSSSGDDSKIDGLPYGTIGARYRAGSAAYARSRRGRGNMAGLDDFQTD